MAKLSIDNVDVAHRRVLTRVDFNVPLGSDGSITDDRRIGMVLPTVRSIIDRAGRAVLMSHLGRPSGTGFEESLSLKPVAERLSELLGGGTVIFPSDDCADDASAAAVHGMQDGEIVLLENLRFHPGEVSNTSGFAARLASFGEVYCDDAFGTAHRAHASIVGVPQAMSDAPRAAGLLLQQELQYLSEALDDPARPFVAILGGAKVSDKLHAIGNLLPKVDSLLIGGAMAYTFLHVSGRRMGKSLVEHDCESSADEILHLAADSPAGLFLPQDHVCGKEMSDLSPIRIFDDHIDDGWMGLDIGPKTQAEFCLKIKGAGTIVWNGPMGVFEIGPFDVGTQRVAEAIAAVTKSGGVTVIGGGDTAAAVQKMGLANRYSHVSTGGGASLRMLEGAPLPGVDALSEA